MKLEDVRKVYKRGSEEIVALDNINYTFEPGKFYAIMGHSGSGNSTLITILGLIDNITSGTYTINDVDVADLSDQALSSLRMKYIGFIFQDFYLDENLKAYENVILPMLINKGIDKTQRKDRALELLSDVGLSDRVNHFPKELSGGEQQRVAIARSLANDPEVILADEPTGNLDEANEEKIFEELKRLSENGKCVIVVSHSNKVKDYADVVLTISKGKLEV